MNNDIEIKFSKIQGKGVFAKRNFKKGEIVLKWDLSHQISKEQYEKLSKSERIYVVFDDEKYFVMQEPFKYVNHSCESNTRSNNFCDIALRDIKKGEEITADYNDDAPPTGETIKCLCGSKNCKLFIKT